MNKLILIIGVCVLLQCVKAEVKVKEYLKKMTEKGDEKSIENTENPVPLVDVQTTEIDELVTEKISEEATEYADGSFDNDYTTDIPVTTTASSIEAYNFTTSVLRVAIFAVPKCPEDQEFTFGDCRPLL